MTNLKWIINTVNRKRVSKTLLIAFTFNIFAPVLTFAAPASLSAVETQANVTPQAQVNKVVLPRDVVPGDTLSITISGSTINQAFLTDNLDTSNAFSAQIDALAEVTSSYDDSTKTFTIWSQIPGTPFTISDLLITRATINPNTTVANVVAIAQVSELSIPQELFAGDSLNFTVNWVGIITAFSWSTDTTLTDFADQITQLTVASGSYNSGTKKITLTAKNAWTAFSMSELVITSNWISVTNAQPNIVPIAQVEKITFPRSLYSDETVTVNIDWQTITQPFSVNTSTTLDNLSSQINGANLSSIVSGGDITITANNPGVAFATGAITVEWGTVNSTTIVPNIEAVAQVDFIALPRALVNWDTLNLNYSGTDFAQAYNSSSDNTVDLIINQLNAGFSSDILASNTGTGILITSKILGTPLASSSIYISSTLNSQNVTENVVPQVQISEYNLPRNLVSWDNVYVNLNWSPYQVDYATSHLATITDFKNTIQNSMSGVLTVTLIWGNTWIRLTANTAGNAFTTSPLYITNTLTPVVLVPNIVPTKQTETVNIANTLIAGDTLSLTLNGTPISEPFAVDEATTFSNLESSINTTFASSLSGNITWKTLTIESIVPGTPFTISNLVTTWSDFTGSVLTPNSSETKAKVSFDLTGIPTTWETIEIWTCIVAFVGWAWTDNDCSDDAANIDTSWIWSVSTVATLLKWLTWINDVNALSLVAGWTGPTNISFTQVNTPTNTLPIIFTDSTTWNITWITFVSPVVPEAQVNEIVMPRDFAMGDSYKLKFGNGVTVTQNFLWDATSTFNALVAQINDLTDMVTATWSNDTITITAKTAWEFFSIVESSFTNTQVSTTTISNTIAQAQKEEVDFKSDFVAGDTASISIDWVSITKDFDTDHTTTISDFASLITAWTSVNATLSGALWLVLEAKTAGVAFTINSVWVVNNLAVNPVQTNVVWVAQVDTLWVPFTLSSSDTLTVNVDGTIVSQAFSSDSDTTLSLLSNELTNLTSVFSQYDAGSFTLTAKTPGTAFTAAFINTGATITSDTITPNVDSGSQVDSLNVNREIAVWDLLSLDIAGHTLTQAFTTDKATTLNNLNTQIDGLAEVSSIFDGNSTFTITAEVPWIPFTSGILTISSSIFSVNQTPNGLPQTQIDNVVLPRTLIAGDVIYLNIDGTQISQSFNSTHDTTLWDLVSNINSSQSGAVASFVWNTITLTASVSGVPFVASNFILENTMTPVTTVANVAPVKQETEISIPTFVAGDMLSFVLNATPIIQTYTIDNSTTVNQLVDKINAVAWTPVDATYNSGSGVIHMISTVAWTPFAVSQVSIINTTPTTLDTPNILPVAKIVEVTPDGDLREWLTFRITIDGTDYDYLTTPTSTLTDIISWLNVALSANLWIIVATDATKLTISSATPWIDFTLTSQVIDITPPTITLPTNTTETLKSWMTSSTEVSINEDWVVYLVLSGTTINDLSDVTNAIANNTAFEWQNPALKDSVYNITIPANPSLVDGQYNFVANDNNNTLVTIMPSGITIHNALPTVSGVNLPAAVNTWSLVLTGMTEPDSTVVITGWSGDVTVTSDSNGAFTGTVVLNPDSVNTLVITVTNSLGSVSTWDTFVVICDMTWPVVFNLNTITPVAWAIMNLNYGFTTNENSTSTFYVWTGLDVMATLVWSGTTTGTGHIGIIPNLASNTTYYYFIESTDDLWNISTTNVTAINSSDSTAPVVISNVISNITDTSALLTFQFQDSNFTLWSATWVINITDWTNNYVVNPTLTYGNLTNDWTGIINWLTESTTYNYTISLTDDFGNNSQTAGSFTTLTNVVSSGTVITTTGAIVMDTTWAIGNTLDLSGTLITINSDSAINSISTGSLIFSGDSLTYWAWWDGIIYAPTFVSSGSSTYATIWELSSLIGALNTSSMTYAGTILDTIQVWGNASLTISGWYFNIDAFISLANVWETLRIYRSTDWNTWQNNTPDATCVVNASKMCDFRSDHLSYFAFARLTGTPVVPVSSGWGGGGGWGWLSMDYCPTGDFSPSYYDRTCGTKPETATWTTTADWTNVTLVEADLVTKAINNIKNTYYDKVPTVSGKVQLWESVIRKINSEISYGDISSVKKDLFVALRTKAESTLSDLYKEQTKAIPHPTISREGEGIKTPTKVVVKVPQVPVKITDIIDSRIERKLDTITFKYLNVDNSYAIRASDSFSSKIISYLPRNYKVQLLSEINNGWSKIEFDWYTWFIRSKYLRNEMGTDVTPLFKVFKYLNVDNSYAIREQDSFSSKIISYLPRNYKVQLLAELPNGWSKISFDWYEWYIRTKYLRGENESDRNRHLPYKTWLEVNSNANIDWKKIKAEKSVFVRERPYPLSKIKTVLFKDQIVIILDQIDWFYEVKWSGWTGFVWKDFVWDYR